MLKRLQRYFVNFAEVIEPKEMKRCIALVRLRNQRDILPKCYGVFDSQFFSRS